MEKPSAVIVETRDHYRFCKRRVGYKGKVKYKRRAGYKRKVKYKRRVWYQETCRNYLTDTNSTFTKYWLLEGGCWPINLLASERKSYKVFCLLYLSKILNNTLVITSALNIKTNIWNALLFAGDDPRPHSAPGRVMLSFWWIFTILVLSTYTANLAAYLTVTIVDSPINSLQELAAQDKIRPLLFTGSNLHTLFQVSCIFKVIHLIIVKLSSCWRWTFSP